MGDPSLISYEVAERVAWLTLDDPDTRNSLSTPLLHQLDARLDDAQHDDTVHCVVLGSSHERIFSSGANLGGFTAEMPLVEKHRHSSLLPGLLLKIGQLGKPVICAASGHVLAGAFGLALACDLILAKEGVEFGTPEINIGVFPFMIMALIYRNLPRKRATELLMLGDRISAAEAERFGIVNRVVAAEDYDATVREWAARLAQKSPLLMGMGKDASFQQQDMPLAEALAYLRSQLTLAHSTDDMHEGVRAFFEKRDPVWRGR